MQSPVVAAACCSVAAALAFIPDQCWMVTGKKGIAERQPGLEQPRLLLQQGLDQRTETNIAQI